MDPVEGFLADIRDNPEDDTPRRILADWLEDRGDPLLAVRGEFIRLGVELAQEYLPAARRRWLVERTKAIRSEHEPAWVGRWAGVGRVLRYERGFPVLSTSSYFTLPGVEEMFQEWLPRSWCQVLRVYEIPEEALPRLLLRMLELTPVHTLRLSCCPRGEPFRRLLDTEGARNLHTLGISGGLDESEFEAFADATLPRLRRLDFSTEWARAHEPPFFLPRCSSFRQLRELNLSLRRLGDGGLVALASLRDLPELQSLLLQNVEAGSPGICALAGSSHYARLRRLDLRGNHVGREGACAVISSDSLPALTHLDLAHNRMDVHSVVGLSLEPGLRRLEFLNLSGNWCGDRGAEALAESPHISELKRLEVARTEIGPAGVRALSRSPYLAGLRQLDLSGNTLGEEGARALAESPFLNNLLHLNVSTTQLTSAGLEALRRRFPEALVSDDQGH
jgi:uncharacterized protein (TIGR02996 family)